MTGHEASSTGARIRVLGAEFLLRTENAAALDFVRREWSRCLIRGDEAHAGAVPPREIPLDALPESALGYDLATAVTRHAIEASIGNLLMFHAAGLAADDGRVLMLVAPSGTGKTTAAAALCKARFGYVSDETVAITSDHGVLPYPKPLSVLDGEGPKVQRSPDDLGLRECPDNLVIHRVVLLERTRTRVAAPTIERLGLLDALLELIPQTSSLFSLDRPLQRLCELCDACGGIYRLTYTEIRDAEDLLVALGDDVSGPPSAGAEERWTVVGASLHDGAQPAVVPAKGVVRRGRHLDAVQVGDEAIVLVGTVPVRLGPLGLTLWRAAYDGATEQSLVAAAIREHGSYQDAAVTVRAAVAQMRRAGLLT